MNEQQPAESDRPTTPIGPTNRPAAAPGTPDQQGSGHRPEDQAPEWAIPADAQTPSSAPDTDRLSSASAPSGSASLSPGPLAPVSPQRRRNRGLLAAAGTGAAVVLLGAGFLAGAAMQGDGNTTMVTRAAQGGAGGYAGQPGEGLPGQAGAGMPGVHEGPGLSNSSTFAAGEITAISGSTLTLKDQQSAAVTVTATSTTTVAGTAGGNLSTLTVGQVVFVTGAKQSDGSYLATAITTTPPFAHGDQDGDHQEPFEQGQASGT